MSGGFFRGTSAEQDTRFSNKMAKLLKTQKFAPELDHSVDITKVKMDVIKPWIATRVTELLGFEDEVLINFIYGLLDGKDVDGKHIQIQLTGFMEKNTGRFMKELWGLLTSAQSNQSGIPQQFLDAKAEETRKKKEEGQRILSEVRKREELEKEAELELDGKMNPPGESTKHGAGSPPGQDGDKKSSQGPDDTHTGGRNGALPRPGNSDHSPTGRNSGRGNRVGAQRGSGSRSPLRSRSRSSSVSRSPVNRRRRSPSISRTPPRRRRSGSPFRHGRSPRRFRSPPRHRRSPVHSRSPRRRKSPPYRSPPSPRSPLRARRRSPARSRSPRRRPVVSRSPTRKRSPSASPSPPRGRESSSRSPPPLPRSRQRNLSRSPPLPPPPRVRRRSPSRSPVPPLSRSRRRSSSRSPLPSRPRRRSPSRSPPRLPPRGRRRSSSRDRGGRNNGGLDARRDRDWQHPESGLVHRRSDRNERRDTFDQHPFSRQEPERRHITERPEQEQVGVRGPLDRPAQERNALKRTVGKSELDQGSAKNNLERSEDDQVPPRVPVVRPENDRVTSRAPPDISELQDRAAPRVFSDRVEKDWSGSRVASKRSEQDQAGPISDNAKGFTTEARLSGSSAAGGRQLSDDKSKLEFAKRPRSPLPERLDARDARRQHLKNSPDVTVSHILLEEGKGKGGRKSEPSGATTDSDSDDMVTDKVGPSERGKASRFSGAQDSIKDDENGSPQRSSEDRRESKRRKKEDKRLRKEEKRKKREERHKRREEKRAARAAAKSTACIKDEPENCGRPWEKDVYKGLQDRSDEDDAESEERRLRLENELRKKALESLRAKRAIS